MKVNFAVFALASFLYAHSFGGAALAAAAVEPEPSEGTETSETARRAVHLLDYIAVDYAGAVADGKVVNPVEYEEQLSFVGEVERRLEALQVPAGDPIATGLAGLKTAIDGKAAPTVVAERARSVGAELRMRFNVLDLPPRAPSLENGRHLYAQACAGCHGATGKGDGPLGKQLDPQPADFSDRERAMSLPLSAVLATITFGIEGTGMASFDPAYGTADRYDLAFYVASLAFDQADVARGAALAQANPSVMSERIGSLARLIGEPASKLAGDDPDGAALVAYARTHPEAMAGTVVSLSLVRTRLDESWQAYQSGDASRAADLAVSAYLDGFEPMEPRLDAVDRPLRNTIEEGFLRYREQMRPGSNANDAEAARERLLDGVAKAETALGSGGFSAAAAFLASLTILAREGFEALLIILALTAMVVKTGRREALRYVRAGWMAAFAAAIVTWIAARRLVEISGAQREIIEGATSLIASVILFYVSYWLIAKVSSQRWQMFLHARISSALTQGSLWTLAFISFIAVYREAFETALFYEALVTQAGPAGVQPILYGALAGAGLLLALALSGFRFGMRMPMRRFFVISSGLLYLLAVILAGQGVAALQEAGYVGVTNVPFVRVDWLGVHPTLQTLGAQALLVVAALIAGVWTLVRRGSEPAETGNGKQRVAA